MKLKGILLAGLLGMVLLSQGSAHAIERITLADMHNEWGWQYLPAGGREDQIVYRIEDHDAGPNIVKIQLEREPWITGWKAISLYDYQDGRHWSWSETEEGERWGHEIEIDIRNVRDTTFIRFHKLGFLWQRIERYELYDFPVEWGGKKITFFWRYDRG